MPFFFHFIAFHAAILPDTARRHEPWNGDVPRFGLAEIRVERQSKEPLPPTPGVKIPRRIRFFFFLNFKIPLNGSEFFLSKIFQRVFQIPGVLASDSTGHHPAPACELSFLKDRSISPGIPCLQPGDVVLFKRMKFAKH